MSELRYDFLKDRWVIVAPERAKRPFSVTFVKKEEKSDVSACPFEPGKEKLTPPEVFAIREIGTSPNSPGWKVRVVPNMYPALNMKEKTEEMKSDIYTLAPGIGVHEIVIETPKHFKQPHQFTNNELVMVFTAYRERMEKLYSDSRIKYVHIFKNHGINAGASITHPHSQIIATPKMPSIISTMIFKNKSYLERNKRCYLCHEINSEIEENKRVVYQNSLFLSYCPFSSEFPFKVRIAPKFHSSRFHEMDDESLKLLADAVSITIKKLNAQISNLAFNMILYSSPIEIDSDLLFHWHIDFLPRLEVIAGFELGTGWHINPVPPEQAAKALKSIEV
jgi:UDPglucose--hexose-1-phosphate uridylyltransferase